MSVTQKFNEGDRVRVVSADPISGDTRFVGKTGVVTQVGGVDLGYDYIVMIADDATAWPFVESELAPLTVKVVEGKVHVYGDGIAYIGDVDINDAIGETGDEVRLTIEVIRKAGESK